MSRARVDTVQQVYRVGMLDDRSVLTYTDPVTGWPAGILTGREDAYGGFQVEHVVTFNRRCLVPMLRAMIETGRRRGYLYLVVTVPHDFPPRAKLLDLARRMGFTAFHRDETRVAWVRYL